MAIRRRLVVERAGRLASGALEDHVTDAATAADLGFGVGVAILIDDEDVWLEGLQFLQEVQQAGPLADEALFDMAQGFEHVTCARPGC